MSDPRRARICAESELAERQARGFFVAGREVVLVRVGTAVHAYVNRCPHRGTSLDWAPNRFMSADGQHLQCATHGALFRPEDGVCVLGPCAGEKLEPLRIERVDGDVWLVR